MYVLKSSDIYSMEQSAKKIGYTEDILMENAGTAVYNLVKKIVKKYDKIAVLAGPGNNGGDGFVTARHLLQNNYNVHIYYTGDDNNYKSSSKTNLDILKNFEIPLRNFEELNSLDEYDIIIDGLFGIGLKREVQGIYDKIITMANKSKAVKVSIDIPSGLYADNAFVDNNVINADYTVTFSCLKYCLCLYPAKKYAGKIKVADITIPKKYIEKYEHSIFINKKNIPVFKKREKDAHKGTFGRVVSIGGSINMAGAVKITAISALKSGCGLVTVIHPNELHRNFISDIPEIMTKEFDYNCPYTVYEFINANASCAAIGNGMTQQENIKEFICDVIYNINKPLIIDADGINNINLDILSRIKVDTVITPHLKEFAKLVNCTVEEIIKNKVSMAKEFADKYNIMLVLKSADTIIAIPNKNIYILNKGNTALSKGGSGDALTGLIASYIAQGYLIEHACILAVYTLGKAAEYAVKKNHPSSLLITDIIKYYKKVYNE